MENTPFAEGREPGGHRAAASLPSFDSSCPRDPSGHFHLLESRLWGQKAKEVAYAGWGLPQAPGLVPSQDGLQQQDCQPWPVPVLPCLPQALLSNSPPTK